MFFSIIINTHNQHETIEKCISSCLNQNFKKKYEIIIVDTSDKKIVKKMCLSKKVRYFHFKNFSRYPEINQIKKIYEGYKKSKGKWFCLIDGDDFFKKNKLKSIFDDYNLNDEIIIQDGCCNFDSKKRLMTNYIHKKYKSYFLYKKIINFWPEIYGTSSISGNLKILKSFFKKININKWNLLAIDALLILYALNMQKFFFNKKVLTIKSIGSHTLGNKYTPLGKNYWTRRIQQISYWENITETKIFNIDKITTKVINLFLIK